MWYMFSSSHRCLIRKKNRMKKKLVRATEKANMEKSRIPIVASIPLIPVINGAGVGREVYSAKR